MIIVSASLLAFLNFQSADISLVRQLNHELGELCQSPPVEATDVCKIHSRLIQKFL